MTSRPTSIAPPSRPSVKTRSGACVVGIDLGGTKILAGLADDRGEVIATFSEPTRHGPQAPVLSQLADIVLRLAREAGVAPAEIARVVVGVPSVVSPQTGLASLSPNLALPEDRPLATLLAAILPCPVTVENDVNLAAFAEAHRGRGQGEGSLVFLSFGTGVGMGLVLGGQVVRGAHGRTGEIAYLPVGDRPHDRAPQSLNGLFEDAVGTFGIRARFGLTEEGGVAALFTALRQGDAAARAALDEIARTASLGIAAIHSMIDPALTVIGGGIGSQPEFFDALKRQTAPLLPFSCRLEQSHFGADAGMIGAVLLAADLAKNSGAFPGKVHGGFPSGNA
ncbi:ROK family protein [Rhizobium paknamense]|uniref:Glucokinase n=1 Tax=Rhizobium paknamense TaxID=1206817 RepID=A0ABU0IC84_9HYPH|nr:ROK family protein [Rhizobium paknamense]MDQ0455853.1 glucokinase [Rhizobium paknamense]